ncbi:MAG TPA: flavodoxin family protein [Bacteroidales bacterium]|jgi:multimeric flavodoxin WrbA|nr:flavodoxin family protein [Bacteroidales bacterium]HOL97389.1 flavodoxin family protein [Bacteroidales bacterium]HOM36120.1 flavodoxin family protein [Bacteroidales bacterium]HPD22956.1 flavodoxin family protein [Bacteroidales bacterium]HRS98625.1 flavodoxin family protein [Bacteroidales bacterium]
MKKIFVLRGSPRIKGNSNIMLENFLSGVSPEAVIYDYDANKINLKACKGCLRCNVLKKCVIRGDDWDKISKKILDADIIVFASPVYFLHFPAPVKLLLDRFRSFVNVNLTENALDYQAFDKWNKDFVLLLSLGSSSLKDTEPIIELFQHITNLLLCRDRLYYLIARRMILSGQILMNEQSLSNFYDKLGINKNEASQDYLKNKDLLQKCKELGESLSKV